MVCVRPARLHSGWCYLCAFALAASHSALVISRKPAPLQAFWPLQEFLAVLQADWPLQAFTPSHLTLPSSAAPAVTVADANSTAAAAASARAEDLRTVMRHLLERIKGEAKDCMATFQLPAETVAPDRHRTRRQNVC